MDLKYKKQIKNISVLLLSVVVSLVLCEVAIRLILPSNYSFLLLDTNNSMAVSAKYLDRMKDNYDEKNKQRILVIGDSVAYGLGVKTDDSIPALMEKFYTGNGIDCEVINAAFPGIGIAQELQILLTHGLKLKPDVVVLGFYLRDFDDAPVLSPPRLPTFLKDSVLVKFLLTQLLSYNAISSSSLQKQIQQWKDQFIRNNEISGKSNDEIMESSSYTSDRSSFNKLIANNIHDWGGMFIPDAWDVLRPFLNKFKDLSIEHGFTPIVVCFPVAYQVNTKIMNEASGGIIDSPQRALGDICNELNMKYINPLKPLRDEFNKEKNMKSLYNDHCHFTSFGNAIAAKYIISEMSNENKFLKRLDNQNFDTNDLQSDEEYIVAIVRSTDASTKLAKSKKEYDMSVEEYNMAEKYKAEVFLNTRVNDLNNLKKALNLYFESNKMFPKSSGGFDGLYSAFGKSEKDWIPGLAPQYIKQLPRDPRLNKDPANQYLYNSNGSDYKLILHNPDDCQSLSLIHPEMIDPVRGCHAYGFWTNGAAQW